MNLPIRWTRDFKRIDTVICTIGPVTLTAANSPHDATLATPIGSLQNGQASKQTVWGGW